MRICAPPAIKDGFITSVICCHNLKRLKINHMKLLRLLLALAWVAAASETAHAKQLAIITDTANSTANLTSAELVKIFNTHTRTWPDGKPITIVLRDPSSADMQLILRKVFNMTVDEARIFIHTHTGTIVVADSDDAVQRFVANNRGAIGVVDLYSLTKDVRVVKIDGKLPVEQGYLLRGN
jgi:ABC-type phosphate transport system substrate-binding protein